MRGCYRSVWLFLLHAAAELCRVLCVFAGSGYATQCENILPRRFLLNNDVMAHYENNSCVFDRLKNWYPTSYAAGCIMDSSLQPLSIYCVVGFIIVGQYVPSSSVIKGFSRKDIEYFSVLHL